MKRIVVCAIISASIFLSFFPGPVAAQDNTASDLASGTAVVSAFLGNSDAPVDWMAVSRAVALLGERGGADSKTLLARILEREKAVEIIEGARLPGVMSPLDMLKAAAMDALGKLAAYEYVDRMKQVYRNTDNKTLRRIAKTNVEALGGLVDE